MGVLTLGAGGAVAAALVTLAGCYAPSLRDCTVSCESPRDCASGQICGSDGLCVSPEAAGRCPSAAPDAAPARDAALPADAAVIVDAPVMISLRVQVAGRGSIVVDGQGVCSSLDPQHGDCTYAIVRGVAQTARAVPLQADVGFLSWTSMTCKGQPASCVFTPLASTVIAAKFDH